MCNLSESLLPVQVEETLRIPSGGLGAGCTAVGPTWDAVVSAGDASAVSAQGPVARLRNLTNTCYINSTIQALLALSHQSAHGEQTHVYIETLTENR